MGTLSQAKSLGGIGSILLLIGTFIPVISIVGFILVLVAVKYLSDSLVDKSIFNNALIAIVLSIVGIVAGIVVGAASVLSFIGGSGMMPFGSGGFVPSDLSGPGLMGLMAGIIVGLVVVWVFTLVSAVFLRKSFNTIASRLNIGHFHTAGLLFLIGAALTIILIGFIIIFVAAIFLTIAFFALPEQSPSPPPPPPSSPPA
ncbi:MAG: DUF996 domain-containing protein [Thaumarchaeota archaeon]|nr:DUF996 domain-containing protein [Nitrososphaerota archaeon]